MRRVAHRAQKTQKPSEPARLNYALQPSHSVHQMASVTNMRSWKKTRISVRDSRKPISTRTIRHLATCGLIVVAPVILGLPRTVFRVQCSLAVNPSMQRILSVMRSALSGRCHLCRDHHILFANRRYQCYEILHRSDLQLLFVLSFIA